MAINLKTKTLPKYNKDEYIKEFIGLVWENAPAFNNFSLNKLPKLTSLSEDDKAIFFKEKPTIQRFLIENNLVTINNLKELKFTEKKRRYKSFEKYLTSLKAKWYNEPWIGYIIAFITLLFAFYQGYQNQSLEKDISSSKLSIDSLRNTTLSHKKKLDSLNVRYVLFESKLSEMKNNTDKKK